MKKARRLLEEFTPKAYQIKLNLEPDNMSFTGKVSIDGSLSGRGGSIVLHSKDLIIRSASIDGTDSDFKRLDNSEELEIGHGLSRGDYQVHIEFEGKITEPMVGLYPCNFEHQGKQKRLFATQFESHHAREVFPCIDEPAAKSTFDLTLVTPLDSGEKVLSNTPIKNQSKSSGLTSTVFEKTPVMSTYLLAFVVGEIEFLQDRTKSGTLVRTWATPNNVEQTKFALDVAVGCLDYFEDYFSIPYPLLNCDLVALPDFAAGAMENWGLITFRESAMLVDEETTSLPSRQWVALVVAHELAHQWFGNLVTMQWWTDLWLNEGFASWVEYLAVDKLFPEWDIWVQFVTDDYLRGQALDSLESSHPIEVDVPDPDEIRNIFDAISYNKGASVIRMLHAYLGPDDFRRGLSHYLKTYSYKNATTADLWAALENVSSKPVQQFMEAWTSQTGFPLVSATRNQKEVNLAQQRYLINPSSQTSKSNIWPVPLNITGSTEQATLDKANDIWKLEVGDRKLNKNQAGFYLINYDDNWLRDLSGQIQSKTLAPVERLGMLNERFQLAKGGYADTVSALRLLDFYSHEDHAAVWDIIAGQLGSIRRVFDSDSLEESMKPYLKKLASLQLKRLGWEFKESDTHFDKLLRPLILATSSFANEETVVSEAIKRFINSEKPEDFHPDLRGPIFGTIARRGSSDDYRRIIKWYKNTANAQLRSSLAGAASSFKDPNLVDENLQLITTDNVRLQEVVHWISFMFGNRHAKDKAWDWLQNNWNWLVDKFGNDIMTFMHFPRIAGRSFSTDSRLDDFQRFFNSVETRGIGRAVDQGYESIQWQTAWKKRDYPDVENFFSEWGQSN